MNALLQGDYGIAPTSFHTVLLAVLLAFLMGQLLAWVYMFTHSGISYSRSFVVSLILMPVIVALVLMVLSNNLVTAFGLMAVFAIVRFRNILRDTLDTSYVLAVIVLGMACGTQKFSTAVVGTLLMVELDGAAMLAKETEALAQDVVDEKVAVDNRIFDALTRAILTLPDYLARLQIGQPDTPLKHLALMNELRAAHQVSPIAELELFAPDLSVRPPTGDRTREKLVDAAFAEMAKQVRGAFQPALLNWLRDNTNKQPLQTIAGIFDELQA